MAAGKSVVGQWNELLLDAIRSGAAKPTETTYQLHLTHSAIYDAWAAYDPSAYGHYGNIERPTAEHTEANKVEAISHAAYRMLVDFFPGQQAKFDAFMAELGLDPADTATDPATPASVGNLAAANVFAARADDGANRQGGYADTSAYAPVNSADPRAPNAPGGEDFDPNRWQPLRVPNGTAVDENGNPVATDDPATYNDQVALTPHFGTVTPFALPSGDAVRPPAPPRLGDFGDYVDGLGNVTTGDAAYRAQFGQVLEISANLTPEQKAIAEYWADGPRTESPPGHWNQIAQDISLREGYGIDDDVKLFFALNAAIFDAGIATWEAKYAYDLVRPQSAIRDLYWGQEVEAWAGPNLGTQTILGEEWQPYQATTFVTPPFPEFTSGHSGFSMAAAKTIAAYVGSDVFHDGVTFGNYDLDDIPGVDLLGQYVVTELSFEDYDGPPITLQWETLTEAAAEAGISRLFGGIHIQDGDLRGREIGAAAAEIAQHRWEALFTRGGDDDLQGTDAGELIIAGAGDDVVLALDGDDTVEGGAGADTIVGGAGDDVIIGGGPGGDLLAGDGQRIECVGEDAYFDSILGYVDAETGAATVVLAHTAAEAAAGFATDLAPPADTVWFLVANGARLNGDVEAGGGYRLGGDAATGYFIETADGTALVSTIRGETKAGAYFSDAAMNPDGKGHVRTLADGTMAWEDWWNQGDRDFNDVVVRLTDNAGADTFVLGPGGGPDTIVDFELGVDRLALAGGLRFADLTFAGCEILGGGEVLATLAAVDTTTLTEDDFTIL